MGNKQSANMSLETLNPAQDECPFKQTQAGTIAVVDEEESGDEGDEVVESVFHRIGKDLTNMIQILQPGDNDAPEKRRKMKAKVMEYIEEGVREIQDIPHCVSYDAVYDAISDLRWMCYSPRFKELSEEVGASIDARLAEFRCASLSGAVSRHCGQKNVWDEMLSMLPHVPEPTAHVLERQEDVLALCDHVLQVRRSIPTDIPQPLSHPLVTPAGGRSVRACVYLRSLALGALGSESRLPYVTYAPREEVMPELIKLMDAKTCQIEGMLRCMLVRFNEVDDDCGRSSKYTQFLMPQGAYCNQKEFEEVKGTSEMFVAPDRFCRSFDGSAHRFGMRNEVCVIAALDITNWTRCSSAEYFDRTDDTPVFAHYSVSPIVGNTLYPLQLRDL